MNRMFWVLIGIALTVTAASMIGFASAHFSTAENAENNSASNAFPKSLEELDGVQCGMHLENEIMQGMHSGGSKMHAMDCMGMSVEEMDNNNDGFCDYCGMSIQECGEMQEMRDAMHGNSSNERMHCGMMSHHEGSGGNAGSMTCGMNGFGMHSDSMMQGLGVMGMHSMMR